jgi:hypothetical protein
MRTPMRLALPFLACCLAALTCMTPAHAQINLAWNNCITQPNQAANIAYACDGSRNALPYRCVVSVISPITLPAFVGIVAVLDIYPGIGPSEHPGGIPLPDFWRLGTGECRDGNILIPYSVLGIGGSACPNPWVGANMSGGYQYTSSSDHARLQLAFARDTQTPVFAGQQFVGVVFAFDTWKDTDTGYGECPGCCSSVVLVANQATLYQIVGSPPTDFVTLTSFGDRTYVTWQSTDAGQTPGCAQTPVRRSTWGSIKATYR